jgi:hypothetical protein
MAPRYPIAEPTNVREFYKAAQSDLSLFRDIIATTRDLVRSSRRSLAEADEVLKLANATLSRNRQRGNSRLSKVLYSHRRPSMWPGADRESR